jgi:quinol monooxygenase YgiN
MTTWHAEIDMEAALVKYGYLGSMRIRPGHRDDVVTILLRDVEALRSVGCELYVVNVSDTDQDVIWVTEVWESKEHHDASLQLPAVKAAIAETMPMLTGELTRQELTVVGGLGVSTGQ